MSKERLVVIGNGMAGVRTVEELLKLEGAERYAITIIGDEPYGNYNRILLSPVLAGENTIDDIILNTPEWYEENGIELIAGVAATGIDRAAREVELADGRRVPYDRLIIATGSRPFILPVPGNDLEGVIGFRDIADVETMIDAAKKYRHAVVIGGGLLGLEAANGLMKNGMDVTVVHLMDTLMERQLDRTAGDMLRKSLEERGMKFVMPAETTELVDDGSGRVKALRTKDGREIPADLVVMAAGIKPNITLAKEAGIHCERGIVVNDYMMTYDPRIYAVGECVQHRGVTYGLVAPLYEQARVLANHLGGRGWMTYEGSVTSTKLKVTGIDLFSAGDFLGRPGSDEIVMHDPAGGTYKKLVLNGNRLTGAVLYGDTVDGSWYFQLIREETDISDIRSRLILGQAHLGDSGHGGDSAADMPDDMEVCGCNGVTKGEIVTAIKEQGLFTLEDVRAVTKASASCGSCTGLVEQILASVLGGDYSAAPSEKPMCGCTDYTHDQVRNAIRENGLKSIPDVMRFLEWRNPDGCASCRPALNYYLLCQWPGEYEDERASRFVNERLHGNIQKDGTYSVVPRMWGGLTTPKELRAIADVVEKYDIPEVKVTGGQRIDLFGVKKEDLPAVWRDLNAAGMVSGHAYGKALRTVKTCAGANWCRFGTQDSTGLGVKLEKMTWGSWMPHKFKFGVSGCPRNCAEATIKDFGVVCVDSGYELHVGGNGGIKVRVTDLIAKVATEEEVLEWAGAFIQLYRENARYLERTAPWIERVGLAWVKERLEDEKERKALHERFLFSQRFAQKDPWAELAEREEEFRPVAELV